MFEIRSTAEFDKWIYRLADETGRAKIYLRIQRIAEGNPGDVRPVGDGVSEMRINFGPGYRVYYKQIGKVVVILLCGGDKSPQDADIKRAKKLSVTL
jgi:putative addiction module killer protein